MKNGSILDGQMVKEDDSSITLNLHGAEINIPKAAIESRMEEKDPQYHARMARRFYDSRQFDQAILQLKELSKYRESELLPLAIADVKKAKEIYEAEGEQGLERQTNQIDLISQMNQADQAGDHEKAASALQQYLETSKPSAPIVRFGIRVLAESLAQQYKLSPEEKLQLDRQASELKWAEHIKFADSPEQWEDIPVLSSAKELWMPTLHAKELPITVGNLRLMYRENRPIDLFILVASRINELEEPAESVITEPIAQQWAAIVDLVKAHEKYYYDQMQNLSTEEAENIKQHLRQQWADNRQRVIARVSAQIRSMAEAGDYGFEMRDLFDYLRRLNPGDGVMNSLSKVETTNRQQLEKIRNHLRAVNQSASYGRYWDNVREGTATVNRGGYR